MDCPSLHTCHVTKAAVRRAEKPANISLCRSYIRLSALRHRYSTKPTKRAQPAMVAGPTYHESCWLTHRLHDSETALLKYREMQLEQSGPVEPGLHRAAAPVPLPPMQLLTVPDLHRYVFVLRCVCR